MYMHIYLHAYYSIYPSNIWMKVIPVVKADLINLIDISKKKIIFSARYLCIWINELLIYS